MPAGILIVRCLDEQPPQSSDDGAIRISCCCLTISRRRLIESATRVDSPIPIEKWYMQFAQGADIASHECFLPPKALAAYFGWDLAQATYVSTPIHTEPAAFGKVMATLKPRMALGYHSVQSPENNAAITNGVRKIYDGPLTLARDLQVINVTTEHIVVRMATVDEYVLPPNVTQGYKEASRTDNKSPGDFINSGKWEGYTPPPMPKK